MRKRELQMLLWAYRSCTCGGRGSLYKAYRYPSTEKEEIWRRICEESVERDEVQTDATAPVIISRNTWIFTAAYISERVDSENGNIIKWFVYHTPSAKYEIPVRDLLEYEYSLAGNN